MNTAPTLVLATTSRRLFCRAHRAHQYGQRALSTFSSQPSSRPVPCPSTPRFNKPINNYSSFSNAFDKNVSSIRSFVTSSRKLPFSFTNIHNNKRSQPLTALDLSNPLVYQYYGNKRTKVSSTSQNSSTIALDVDSTSSSQDKSQSGSKTMDMDGLVALSKPIVGYWLLFMGSLVFGIVVLGGLTRLTESGLSITEWDVIRGMKPPRSPQEWEVEFEKYKAFPEYKLLNRHMTLEEFKTIFYFEWAHRMWGRAIGLGILIPASFFAYKGYMTRAVSKRVLGILALIGFQGALGWYMVKSGLDQALMETPGAVPRVSQYRLTAHLATAFLAYTAMITTGMEVLSQYKERVAQMAGQVKSAPKLLPFQLAKLARFTKFSKATTVLIFVTAMSGGFVAGLDAGLIYNEFPFMGESIVPADIMAYSDPVLAPNGKVLPWWANCFENPSTVQFQHRVLAVTTFSAITALQIMSRKMPLNRNARMAMHALMGMAMVQVTLGISTLIYYVPIPLAAAHQAGSLALLTCGTWLVHALKYVPK